MTPETLDTIISEAAGAIGREADGKQIVKIQPAIEEEAE